MSTEFKPTSQFSLTRFYGGTDRGACVQVTQRYGIGLMKSVGYVDMTMDQARELAVALWELSEGVAQEDR